MRWFGALEKLARLPVRDQEEPAVSQSRKTETYSAGRKPADARASDTTTHGTSASSVIVQRRRTGNG